MPARPRSSGWRPSCDTIPPGTRAGPSVCRSTPAPPGPAPSSPAGTWWPAGGIYAGARDGNELPYIPAWRLAAGIGVIGEQWGLNLDMTYTDSSWGTGYNDDPRPGTLTIRDGRIPSLLLVDLTGNYQLTENIKLLAGVQNIFEEQELVSAGSRKAPAPTPRACSSPVSRRSSNVVLPAPREHLAACSPAQNRDGPCLRSRPTSIWHGSAAS